MDDIVGSAFEKVAREFGESVEDLELDLGVFQTILDAAFQPPRTPEAERIYHSIQKAGDLPTVKEFFYALALASKNV